MAQPDGRQASILTILRMQILYIVLVIVDPHSAVATLLALCSRG